MFDLGILREVLLHIKNGVILKYILAPLSTLYNTLYKSILHNEGEEKHSKGLFQPGIQINKIHATSTLIKSCAVDEFDFMQESHDQIPFNWDINDLVELPNYLTATTSSSNHFHHQQQLRFIGTGMDPTHPASVAAASQDYHGAQQTHPSTSSASSSSIYNLSLENEYETALDEELTFVNRSKNVYMQMPMVPQYHYQQLYEEQQRQQQVQQPLSQLQYIQTSSVKREEFAISLNDVSSMFDSYLLETEAPTSTTTSMFLSSSSTNPTSSDSEQLQQPEIRVKQEEPMLKLEDFGTIPKDVNHKVKEEEKEDEKNLKKLKSVLKLKKQPKLLSSTSSFTKSAQQMGLNQQQQGNQIFQCKFCSLNFKVKGYLTRHMKKHSDSKLFVCPFYSLSSAVVTEEGSLLQPSNGSAGTHCHPTGGFSRRDTFKTHLKALHFIYPPGTRSNSRNSVGGRCAGCFTFFDSNTVWLQNHIETNECPNMLHKCS